MSEFLARNKPDWDELERLLARARKHFARLTPQELARLDVLYRRTTVHLAQVATRTSDQGLARYLNDLTAAAHSLIYLPPRRSMFAGAAQFVTSGFPRAVARSWRFHALAGGLLLAGALVAYFAALADPLAAYALSMPGDVRTPGATREQLESVLRHGREQGAGNKFAFASVLFSHNLKVGILSLATGVLAAVPTVFLLFYNGMLLGAFTALHHQAGIYDEYWAWILPHGVSEISAIVLCGGVGLVLGRSVLAPGELARSESLRRAGVEATTLCIGVAGMLILAAIAESYVRQSHLSTAARLAFAAATALFWAAYFAHGGLAEWRARRAAQTDAVS